MGDMGGPAESAVVAPVDEDVTPVGGPTNGRSPLWDETRSCCAQGRVVQVDPTWTDDMPIFLSPRWLSSQSPEYGWLTSELSPDVRVVLPYAMQHRLLLRWVRLQWGVWSTEDIDVEDERAFLERAVGWFRAHGVDLVAPPPIAAVFATAPRGAISAPFGTLVLDLGSSEDAIWTRMQTRCRNMVRRATADGVTIEWGNHLVGEAHALCAATMGRSDLGFPPLPLLREMVAGLDSWADIGIARLDGVPKASVVIVWSRFGAHCLYAGTAAPVAPGAANLLQWQAIRRAKERGAARYDFMGVRLHPQPGSKYEGMRRFKERFGGELVEGCLWKMPLVRWKWAAYNALKHARGDGADLIDQENVAT